MFELNYKKHENLDKTDEVSEILSTAIDCETARTLGIDGAFK